MYVMTPSIARANTWPNENLTSLAIRLHEAAGREVGADVLADYSAADSESARWRAVVDQVASLTDASAKAWSARLG